MAPSRGKASDAASSRASHSTPIPGAAPARASATAVRSSKARSPIRSQSGRSQLRASSWAPSALACVAARAAMYGSRRSAGSSASQRRRSWSASCTVSSDSNASERKQPGGRGGREALMLDEQPRRLQRLLRQATEARRLQLQAQGMGPARDTERQLVEQLAGAGGVAVVERPFGGEQARAFLGRARRRAALRQLEGASQFLVAQGPVLEAMRAARGEQVGEDGEFVVLRQLGRLGLDRERALRRLLRPRVAAAEVLGERLAQRRLAAAIAARGAPFARPSRQADERVHALDHGDEQEARADQQQDEEVERQVEPPAGPVEARQAVVGPEGRRRDDGDGEQQDEPDRQAHQRAPSAASAANVSSGRAGADWRACCITWPTISRAICVRFAERSK